MKKILFFILVGFVGASAALAGGIMTNTNQSASFIRLPARGATFDLDAVYYNPAGLAFLQNGFHISLNNQYVTQMRTIESDFGNMNRQKFEGGVTAPIFPSVYAIYKMDRLAFSFGFNPIGGGGSASFDDGLPSFEMQPSTIPGSLAAAGIPTTAYSMDVSFQAQSIMYGFQANATYKINEMISIAAGLRYIMVNNTYEGYLRDIRINPTFPAAGYTGDMVVATTFFTDMSAYFTGVSTSLLGAGNALDPYINNNLGHLPLANAPGMTPTEIAQLQGAITQVGGDPTGMTIAQAQGFLLGASAQFSQNSQLMAGNAAATVDREVDASQSGSGIAPIIGINLKLSDNFNLGFKYEHKASMKVKNETARDDVGLFPDGMETPSDMPSMFAIGASYAPARKLKLHGTFHYYLDKQAEYGKMINGQFVTNDQVMDNNFWEAAFGAEYTINDKFLVSGGYLRTQTGVMEAYQSDMSHSLSTNSIGLGLRYKAADHIGINLGAMNTWYMEDTRSFTGYTETYNRTATVIAIGIDMSF